MKVYMIDLEVIDEIDNINALNDKEFKQLADKQHNVYTLKEFEREFNDTETGVVDTNSCFIRFLED